MTKEFLQEKRKEKNFSQEEFARRINKSVDSIRKWEQGKQDLNKMSLETYIKICFVLDLQKGEGL